MNALRGILGAIRTADQKFTLFENGDKILVGVSGGKDSIALLYALKMYQKFKIDDFEIIPCILDLGFDGFDAAPIKEFVKTIGFDLHIADSKEVFPILSAHKKNNKLPCSICSRMKKAAINKVAKELGCNKVAFAHHIDDAIETLFMNEIYGGRIATFEAKMKLERANITFIRPFILVKEEEIKEMMIEENLLSFPSCCPNDGHTSREDIKQLLNNIYNCYPEAKDNFITMLLNYKKGLTLSDGLLYKLEKSDLTIRPCIDAHDGRLESSLSKNANKLDGEHFLIYKKDKPIGVLIIHVENHQLFIDELKLKTKSRKATKRIIEFITNQINRTIKPLEVIDNSNH